MFCRFSFCRFSRLPPEVNLARIYSGAGSASLHGAASMSMAAAADPLVGWLSAAAGHAHDAFARQAHRLCLVGGPRRSGDRRRIVRTAIAEHLGQARKTIVDNVFQSRTPRAKPHPAAVLGKSGTRWRSS